MTSDGCQVFPISHLESLPPGEGRDLFGGANGLEGTKPGQTPVKEAQRGKEAGVSDWNAPSPAALLPTSFTPAQRHLELPGTTTKS